MSGKKVDDPSVESEDAKVSSSDQKTNESQDVINEEEVAAVAVENEAVAEVVDSNVDSLELNKEPDSAPITQKRKSRCGGSKLLFVSVLLPLLAVAGAVYWLWQTQQQEKVALEKQLASMNEALNAKILGQQESLDMLARDNRSGDDSLAQLRSQMNQVSGQQDWVKQRLENHTNRIRALTGTSREDWLLSEAKYLLRLANQRLLTERGTESAQALLQSVDKLLAEFEDVDLFVVREAIQDDIASLKLAKMVDREGIYLRIGALAKKVRDIPSILSVSQSEPEVEAQEQKIVEQSWGDRFLGSAGNAWEAVAGSIEVRHYDEPPSLFLTEHQEATLRYNLQLLLTQAQLALLREEEEIYRNSLQESIDWINQYFSYYESKSVLIEELNALKNESINQSLPDISNSLKILTDYIEQFHRLNPEKPKSTTTEGGA